MLPCHGRGRGFESRPVRIGEREDERQHSVIVRTVRLSTSRNKGRISYPPASPKINQPAGHGIETRATLPTLAKQCIEATESLVGTVGNSGGYEKLHIVRWRKEGGVHPRGRRKLR